MATVRIFREGEFVGEEGIEATGLAIGRGDDVELRLDDAGLSRRHATIEPDGVGWSVEDLGSKNGTFVNGVNVKRQALKDGDKIELGKWVLQFRRAPTEVPLPRPTGKLPRVDSTAPTQPTSKRVERPTVGWDPALLAQARAESSEMLEPRLVEKSLPVTIHPLTTDRVVIGDDEECGIRVDKAGRGEAAVVERLNRSLFVIKKLGWLSRVKVNGNRVHTAYLTPGDIVEVGAATFVFEMPLG